MLADLAHAIRGHALPVAPFRDLLSAFAQDVTVQRYATFADVVDYCRRSADPIGRLLLALYHVDAPADFVASDAICTALQLTNFWQDIASDYRRGRVYIPQEDLIRFGISETQIADLPGARRMDVLSVPGGSPDTYAFYRGTTQRNLYRIPLQ